MGTISVSQLGKAYKQYPSRGARLAEWLIPNSPPRHAQKWVLRDISFEVKPGEAVGIIGLNGAGKSTLLKMITGTTEPTTGTVSVTGRIAALLELGMGFHPDFTGRQNAITAGQLLGLSADEMRSLMPAIEAFAEIGDYIDQPVRVYSSGMQMRLAFSVATAKRPDILIVDEALSVGDNYFQHKSFDRIRAYNKLGTTLLIVSHDKGAVQGICDRAILLSGGGIAMQGNPEAVMDYYNAMIAERDPTKVQQLLGADGTVQTISGTGEARVIQASLCDEDGKTLEVLKVGQPVQVRVEVEVFADIPTLVFGYQIKDRLGQPVFGTNTFHTKQLVKDLKVGQHAHYVLQFPANFGEGSYSMSFALHADENHLAKSYDWRDRAIVFSVVIVAKDHFVGLTWLPTSIEIKRD